MIFSNLVEIHIITTFIFLDILLKDTLGTSSIEKELIGRDPISRLAFRVQCSRSNPLDVRIAAAGFDSANELFLGPNALRWSTQSEGGAPGAVDGGITVG